MRKRMRSRRTRMTPLTTLPQPQLKMQLPPLHLLMKSKLLLLQLNPQLNKIHTMRSQ